MCYATIKFKSKSVFENAFYVEWHQNLIELTSWIIEIYDMTPLITSAYRPGDPGVHGTDPLRGIDIRGKGPAAKSVSRYINKFWQYDSKRKTKMVAMVHNVGRGEHIHIQVCDNTVIYQGGYNKQKNPLKGV